MNEMSGRSLGPSSRYTVLALNVAKIAGQLGKRDVAPAETQLLTRAADFVATIIEGSAFVERRDVRGLSNARVSLFTVDHAIAALKNLTLDPEHGQQLTHIFQQYEADLRTLAAGGKIGPERLSSIRNFFDALADLFYREVIESTSAPHVDVYRR